MPHLRRPALATEVERRLAERRARIGGELRRIRLRRRWTQHELADRAGVGRLVVTRIESGKGPLQLDALESLSVATGVALIVDFGRDLREDVADAGHLAMQELVLRLAKPAGYEPSFELATRPAEPWRSADVALAKEARRLAIEVECWNSMGDVGAATRTTTRKVAELEALAVARWGAEARVASVWVVRATARNRDLIARYPEVFATRFPGSSRGWVDALTTGAEPPAQPGLVWCDVGATKLFAWRRR